MIDWTKPLVVAGTDRVATVETEDGQSGRFMVIADWNGAGLQTRKAVDRLGTAGCFIVVANTPPKPQIGPEHIEALAEVIGEAEDAVAEERELMSWDMSKDWTATHIARHAAAEQRAARLAEIRAYLENPSD